MSLHYSVFPANYYRFYNISVNGRFLCVTVTAIASAARRWLRNALNNERNRTFLGTRRLVVGIGVQWTPGRAATGRECIGETLQLCIGSRCLVFQIEVAQDVPFQLRRFLMNRNCTFVGFWTLHDRQMLYNSRHWVNLHMNPIDLRYSLDPEFARASVSTIIRECVGFREAELRREIFLSNWSVETLSDDQVLHAAIEAYGAFLIGIEYRAWRRNRSRSNQS